MKKTIFSIFLLGLVLAISLQVMADLNGRTGRTRKSSTSGCSCHSSVNSATTVTIAGPDTVQQGTSAQYTLTISNASLTGAGCDIATRLGTLGNVSGLTHLASGEITHSNNMSMTNHTITIPFNYTAPGTTGTDTIWAQGLATNSNGSSSGDIQNFAPEKKIVVRGPLGINNEQTAVKFELHQNYPNPFNPATTITFELSKASNVNLTVYDAQGEKVQQLLNDQMTSGSHEISWNATDFASGVYYYVLKSDDIMITKKMILIK